MGTPTTIQDEVRAALNDIVDPCSVAAGTPLGLVDMGIVREVQVIDSTLRIELLPTFPACRFVPIFEAEIRKRLSETGLTVIIEIVGPEVVWDESMMAPAARDLVERRRRETRAGLVNRGPRSASRPLPVLSLKRRAGP